MMDHQTAARVIADECLCFRARRVSRALTRLYDEALRPLGLHATQLTLLSAIAVRGEDGWRMSALAEVLAMDPTTVSRNVRLLEKDGLVRIAPSPDDGRVRLVRLTSAGERRVEDALPLWKRAHERVVAALGPEATAELRDRFDAAAAAAAGDPSVHPEE